MSHSSFKHSPSPVRPDRTFASAHEDRHAGAAVQPTPPAPTAASEPETLHSPLKPLLWLLIPFVLVLLYGFFGG